MEDKYILVLWPQSKEFMSYDWFRKECYLCVAFEDESALDSTCFVPENRYKEVMRVTNSGHLSVYVSEDDYETVRSERDNLRALVKMYEESLGKLKNIIDELKGLKQH